MTSKKLLYFFNNPVVPSVLPQCQTGIMPSDRLYGVVELLRNGWDIEFCDERLSKTEQFFRKYTFSFINFATLKKCKKADILVVKDNFSLMLTLFARIFNKRIIYLDSLFYVPKSKIRRFFLKLNLMLKPTVVAYSQYQVDLWAGEFNVSKDIFVTLPYTVDIDFYNKGIAQAKAAGHVEEPFILAAGRDTGRDFKTLVIAATKLGMKVKLVTLSYLIPEEARDNPLVEVLQYITYEELFALYTKAAIVAVPLRKGIDYPSGIRAVLEAMLVGKATICTHTGVLEEYIPTQENALLYVAAEDVEGFTQAIQKIMSDNKLKETIEENGKRLVSGAYSMSTFVSALEQLIHAEAARK